MDIMRERQDLLINKKEEIKKAIDNDLKQFLTSNLDIAEIEKFLYDSNYLSITPPLEEPPMMGFVLIDSLQNYNHGRSIKPGNIKLNIKHLISTLPELIAATVSAISDTTILKICAAISLWKMLRNEFTVEIKKEQAIVLFALWRNCNDQQRISIEEGYNTTNLLCRQVSEKELTLEQYNRIIEELEKIRCIELDDRGIWLREWISKKYTGAC